MNRNEFAAAQAAHARAQLTALRADQLEVQRELFYEKKLGQIKHLKKRLREINKAIAKHETG